MQKAPYANLGGRVGFIYGSIAAASVVFAFFFVPDCRGRSLEDVNRLFESGASPRVFHKIKLEPLVDISSGKVELTEAGREADAVAHGEKAASVTSVRVVGDDKV